MDGLLLWALSIILSVLATWYVSRRDSRRSTVDISQKIEQLGKSLASGLPPRIAETIRPYLAGGREREAAEAIQARVADEIQRVVQVIGGVGGIPSGEAFGRPTITQDLPPTTDVRAGHWHGPQGSFGEARVAQPGDAEKKPEKPSGPYGASGG